MFLVKEEKVNLTPAKSKLPAGQLSNSLENRKSVMSAKQTKLCLWWFSLRVSIIFDMSIWFVIHCIHLWPTTPWSDEWHFHHSFDAFINVRCLPQVFTWSSPLLLLLSPLLHLSCPNLCKISLNGSWDSFVSAAQMYPLPHLQIGRGLQKVMKCNWFCTLVESVQNNTTALDNNLFEL